jgi:hypothetical protein
MFRRRGKGDTGADTPTDFGDEPLTPAELAGGIDALDRVDEDEDEDDLDGAAELDPEYSADELESQAADYLADNDVWMYGTNAPDVVAILDALEDSGADELVPLAQAWRAVLKSDREAARKAVRKLTETDLEASRHLQMAREAVGTWLAVAAGYPEFVKAVPDWAATATQAGEATLDALTAVILATAIDEDYHDTLYSPWDTTMGLPAELDEGPLEAASLAGGADADEEEADADESDAEFGPNSDLVADFLNRLWLLSPEQVGRLVSAWQGSDPDDLAAAHDGLNALVDEEVAGQDELRAQVRRAQDQLIPWLNGGRIEDTAGFLGQTGQGESRKMAGPTLADAMAALVLGDLLKRVAAETLYGPWFNLVGAPPLPDPAKPGEDEN